MPNDYRLIWFHHFHKAAGTSIVDMAVNNGERFWPNHSNGNPVDEDGKTIELWSYDEAALREFIDRCESLGVTFVATEWGLPDLDVLGHDERVFAMTCLRNPLSRYVSSYYFELHYGFTPARSLDSYESTRERTFTMFNYYTRTLSGKKNAPGSVEESEFTAASQALGKFDLCAVLEDGLDPVANALGWAAPGSRSNVNTFSLRQAVSLLRRGKFGQLWHRISQPKKAASAEFQETFKRGNEWDIRLYKSLSRAR